MASSACSFETRAHTCCFCGTPSSAIVERNNPLKLLRVCLACLKDCRMWRSLYRIVFVPVLE